MKKLQKYLNALLFSARYEKESWNNMKELFSEFIDNVSYCFIKVKIYMFVYVCIIKSDLIFLIKKTIANVNVFSFSLFQMVLYEASNICMFLYLYDIAFILRRFLCKREIMMQKFIIDKMVTQRNIFNKKMERLSSDELEDEIYYQEKEFEIINIYINRRTYL